MAGKQRRDAVTAPVKAGIVQLAAAALALAALLAGIAMTPGQWALVQGALAMRIATLAGAPRWWPPLHLAFVPGLVAAQSVQLDPLWWAAAFATLALVFGATFRTQVPLFLTARAVREHLERLLVAEGRRRFIDLGCGLGTVIATLKRRRPECEFHGVELAPLPYLLSRMVAGRAGCRIERRDLMEVDLSEYDVVYAFLSPVPMPALWAKAQREMRAGSLFVSLGFAVPHVEPQQVIRVSDAARHTLYVWRM
jgi:hypothetical protein